MKQETARKIGGAVCVLACLLAAGYPKPLSAATPTVFATCPAGKVNGLAATQNKLLYTLQTDPLHVYQIDSTGTTCSVFATLPALATPLCSGNPTVEMYIAVSEGLGGFTAGDIFVVRFGNVYRIAAAGGAGTLFATIPAFNANQCYIHSGIGFDTSGNYGNKMFVTGQDSSSSGGPGEVYTVDSTGTATLLLATALGGPSYTDGIIESPRVTSSAFAPAPSTLLVTQEEHNVVEAITPGGSVGTLNALLDIGAASPIPSQVCSLGSQGAFFITDWNGQRILQYAASSFTGLSGVLFPVENDGFSQTGAGNNTSIWLEDNTGAISVFDPSLVVGGTAVVHEGAAFVTCRSLAGCTVTQGGWHAPPHRNNPGALLAVNFSKVYPGGQVLIGGTFTLTFTSAGAVQAFLPQGGTPGVLNTSQINPTSSSAGVFAGQVLTLRLNVDFSAAGVNPLGLGNFILKNTGTSLDGDSVSQILAIANQVLGGNLGALPAGYTVSSLNDLIDNLNQAFDGCVVDGWAQTHLG